MRDPNAHGFSEGFPMTQADINTLEHAGRTATAWATEGYDGETHYSYVLKAMAPAIGILAVAATLLFAVL
jgi:hypothetical protein